MKWTIRIGLLACGFAHLAGRAARGRLWRRRNGRAPSRGGSTIWGAGRKDEVMGEENTACREVDWDEADKSHQPLIERRGSIEISCPSAAGRPTHYRSRLPPIR